MQMEVVSAYKKFIGIFLLYSVVALAILAPISSEKSVPALVPDLVAHTGGIIQAAKALEEGQFPLRVAPIEHDHLRYPVFQFYSPFSYTLAGYIYKFVTPNNPFLALKTTIWLLVVLAGLYIYSLAKEISESEVGAVLAGMAYMVAPYLLININARGAFNEIIAQGFLPIVLYYTYKMYSSKNLSINYLCVTALVWSLLAMSHLITFINAGILIAFFLLFLNKKNPIKRLFFTGLAVLYGFLLSIWYIVPVVVYENLLNIAPTLVNPITTNFLTTLPKLFALSASGLIWPSSYSVPL